MSTSIPSLMNTPILTSALASVDVALMRAKHASKGMDTLLTQELEDALGFILEAIKQVQGAREDAFRMAGRVQVCTELYDILAPDECTFDQLIARHPRLEAAYSRFSRLDANGACCVATDILEAAADGCLDADKLADELLADCERMERGEE